MLDGVRKPGLNPCFAWESVILGQLASYPTNWAKGPHNPRVAATQQMLPLFQKLEIKEFQLVEIGYKHDFRW